MTHTLIKIKNQSLVIEPKVMASDYTITEKVILSYVRQNRVVDFTDICLFLNIDMKTAAEACASLKLLQEDITIGNTTKSMIFEESTYNEIGVNNDKNESSINFNEKTKTIEKENSTPTIVIREEKDTCDRGIVEDAPLPNEVVNVEYTRLDLRNFNIKEQIKDLPKEELYDNSTLTRMRDMKNELEQLEIHDKDLNLKDEAMTKTAQNHFTCDINGLRDENTWKPIDANYKTPPEEKEYAFWDDDDLGLAENNKDAKIEQFVAKERAIIEELATTRGINGQEIPIVKVDESDDPWACSKEEQEQWDRDIASLFNTEYDEIEMKHDAIIKENDTDLNRFNKDVALIENDWNRWLARTGYYAWIEPEGYTKQCSFNKYAYYSDYIHAVKDKLNFYDLTMYMICQINRICDYKVGAIFNIFKPEELKKLKAINKPCAQIFDDFKVIKVKVKTKAEAIETYRYAVRIACENGNHAKIR